MDGDRKTFWIIGGAAVAVVVVIAVIVAVRNAGVQQLFSGLTSGFSTVPGQETENGGGQANPQDNRVICGDRVCTSSESVETCPIDCVDREVFSGFSVSDLPNGDAVVSWTTSKLMTSVIDYQTPEMDDFARLGNEDMSVEHEVIIKGFESGLLNFRISGVDQDGTEYDFGEYVHER
jgi:hypothetical protein